MNILNKLYLIFFTRKIIFFYTESFSLCFPINWRKSIGPKKSFVFFEETTNYGFIIEEYCSQKITADAILDVYAEKHSECIIKPIEEIINDNIVLKWIFDYENEKVLEYKRLIIGDKVILDITYSIQKNLSTQKNIEAIEKLESIMNSIKLK